MLRKLSCLAIASFPLSALASDYTGLSTLAIGFPFVIAGLISNFLLVAQEKPEKDMRTVNGVITALFVFSLLFVMGDVLEMLGRNDKMIAVLYLLLAAIALGLAFKNFSHASPPGNPPP